MGTAERPRLSVFRSPKNISVQLIDDIKGHTLVSVSTIGEKKPAKEKQQLSQPNNRWEGKMAVAKAIGKLAAEKALARGIKKVVFDRGRFLYHGRVKALADAAREGGLQF